MGATFLPPRPAEPGRALSGPGAPGHRPGGLRRADLVLHEGAGAAAAAEEETVADRVGGGWGGCEEDHACLGRSATGRVGHPVGGGTPS